MVSPEAILTGHVESVVCVSISASLALVVSGARRKPRNLCTNDRVCFAANAVCTQTECICT